MAKPERELSDVGKGVNYAAGCFIFIVFAVCAIIVLTLILLLLAGA